MELTSLNETPFHVVSLIIFLLAISHTLLAHLFTRWGDKVAQKCHCLGAPKSFAAEVLYFLGEVEVIFGIYVVPLLIAIAYFYDWNTAIEYIDGRNFIEPMFVVIIMALTATRPIVLLVERSLEGVARFFGGDLRAYWTSILVLGPILGSIITEPGAMTLCAIMLSHKFYAYQPSKKLAYATLGLLFVNISVGGVLTNFAAPPVLIVSHKWSWSTLYMIQHFGYKALIGILISTFCYFILFSKEMKCLAGKVSHIEVNEKEKVPLWITIVHLLFLCAFVYHGEDPPIFVGGFLLFLGFYQATRYHQYPLNLKPALLVGFFLAGLVVHGGLQGWWIIPLMGQRNETTLMTMGAILTAFNDNAAVVYLSSLIPTLTESAKQAVVSGVLVGGGLTVIANAPNPAGQSILGPHFKGGISPLFLFCAAFLPTCIQYVIFYFGT